MSIQPADNQTPRCTAGLMTAGLFILVVLLFGGHRLLGRQMWMDEVHTWIIVTDPDIGHAMTALSQGADYNPPTYYLLLRGFASVVGNSIAAMRMFSLLAMAAGLGLVAVMLQQRFSMLVATTATLAIAIHPILVHQATEARFYAVWFALLAGFCFLRSRGRNDGVGPRDLRSSLVESVLAVLVCTVHYFGVLSLGLVFLLEVYNRRQSQRASLPNIVRFCVPYAAGVIAIMGCFAFYFGQRSTLTAPTWISPPTTDRVRVFLVKFLPFMQIAIAGLGWIVFRNRTDAASGAEASTVPRSLLLAGFGMPWVIVVFSYLIQPALIDRYAIVCLLSWPPVFAFLIKDARPAFLLLFLTLCLILGRQNVQGLQAHHEETEAERNRLTNELVAMSDPVIFEDRIDHYAAFMSVPTASWFLLDFDSSQDEHSALRVVQRDVGRAVHRHYPQLQIRKLNDLVGAGQTSFIVVPYKANLSDNASEADIKRLHAEYPDYKIRRLARRVFRFDWNGLPAAATP